jgi:hypothetical protein
MDVGLQVQGAGCSYQGQEVFYRKVLSDRRQEGGGLAVRVKIVANAHLGRIDEARAELSRMLAIDPELTIAGFPQRATIRAPELLELYVTDLRLAGLPEGWRASPPAAVLLERGEECRQRGTQRR